MDRVTRNLKEGCTVQITPSNLIVYVLIATFVPVIIFSVTAMLAAGPKIESQDQVADDFLLANRSLKISEFVSSSTGYMLQVSTTFYFIYWGYNYGFSNILYLASWAAGIILFGRFSRRLIELRVKFTSLPYLISGDTDRRTRILASVATAISFVGVFYVEAFFAADLITSAGGLKAQGLEGGGVTGQWWAVFIVVATVTSAYSMLGGLRKVVANDLYQLAFSYFGLSVVFTVLIHKAFSVSSTGALLMAAICIGIMLIILIADRRIFDGHIKGWAVVASLIMLVSVVVLNTPKINFSDSLPQIPGVFKQLSEDWGWFTLLGFTITNLAWQFSDSSVFQRIAALKLSQAPERAEQEIRRALRSLAIVSPITWGLGIVLGMLIKAAGIAVEVPGTEYFHLVDYLRKAAFEGSLLSLIALLSLVVGLVSIMMSTVDVAIIAGVQTVSTDLRERSEFHGWHATVVGLAFLVAVVLLALYHKSRPDSSILTVMAGAYASLILLAPLTLARLLNISMPPGYASAAILLGITGTIAGTFGPIDDLHQNIKLVLPIYTAIVPSALVVLVGYLLALRAQKKLATGSAS
jgi:Na+/proline symporter